MYLTYNRASSCWIVGEKEGDLYIACVKLAPRKRERNTEQGPAWTADQERGTWFDLNEDGQWQENPCIKLVRITKL